MTSHRETEPCLAAIVASALVCDRQQAEDELPGLGRILTEAAVAFLTALPHAQQSLVQCFAPWLLMERQKQENAQEGVLVF